MIQENYKIFEDQLSQICKKSSRDRSEITLVAVSKTKPLDVIISAQKAGLVHFGENKAQEFRDKSEELNGNLIWHFIGHLQTNKVKYVIKHAEYIHSIESEKLVDEINRRAARIDKIQKILIECNTSGEESKYGISNVDDLAKLLEYCKNSSNIDPVGLMTMAPFTDDEVVIGNCFAGLRSFKDKMNDMGFGLRELSMGMTNDYGIAIEEGATMIRIGTAIFGDRNYNK